MKQEHQGEGSLLQYQAVQTGTWRFGRKREIGVQREGTEFDRKSRWSTWNGSTKGLLRLLDCV